MSLVGSALGGLHNKPKRPSIEYGTHKTVKTRFWPWISGQIPSTSEGVPSSLGSSTKRPVTCLVSGASRNLSPWPIQSVIYHNSSNRVYHKPLRRVFHKPPKKVYHQPPKRLCHKPPKRLSLNHPIRAKGHQPLVFFRPDIRLRWRSESIAMDQVCSSCTSVLGTI